MTYRIAFTRTQDGYLEIIASAPGTPPLTALNLNPRDVDAAARLAALSEQHVSELKETAEEAWTQKRS